VSCAQTARVAELALLPVAERTELDAHVEGCPACRAELDAITDLLAHWPTDLLCTPAPLWDRLAQRIGADGDRAERWADEPDWRDVGAGISSKLLATDDTTKMVSMLVRLAPGAAYPAHVHAAVEELHLLDGELWIDGRKLDPGDYNRAEPGTADHRVWSETGCTCVLITSFHDVLHGSAASVIGGFDPRRT
jgi:anti-sigma factor ChrR (cupin superfamily)